VDNCKNCNSEIVGKFCSDCGFPKEPKRIDRHYIIDEISSVLNFDKGLFYTIRELLIRPGDTVKNFIDGDRGRIVKPIIFLIICSLIYTVGQQFFNYKTEFITLDVPEGGNKPIVVVLYDWFSQNFGYANILMSIFIAIWIKIFFRKYNYNFYEIYILLCFTMGVTVLMYTLLGIIESIIKLPVLDIGKLIVFIYSSWAIGQFFDRKKKMSYLKGFFSYVLGLLTSLMILSVVGSGLQILLN